MKSNIVLKKGMALPIVLAFATIMAVVSAFLIKSTKNTNVQMQSSMDQLQSYFIARAGVEHAALKIKYLNSELYDAICMQQGRSPLFNYSLIQNINQPWAEISEYNPGPIFLYRRNQYTRTGIISNMPNNSKNWINAFKCDLVSSIDSIPNSIKSKYIVNGYYPLEIVGGMPKEMKDAMGDRIFKQAVYRLRNIEVAAAEVRKNGTKVENNMIVEFTIDSILQTAKGKDFNYEIKKTMMVSRDK